MKSKHIGAIHVKACEDIKSETQKMLGAWNRTESTC